MDFDSSFQKAVLRNDNGESGSGASTSSWMSVAFFVAVGESLVMLVNEFVLPTQVVVQNCRANYFVRKYTAATIGTLISEPAIGSTGSRFWPK